MVAIGTEIRKISINQPAYFETLIDDVRRIYDGKITYASNWDNYKNIQFWKKLDYIGIDAYFPSSKNKTPEVKDLIQSNTSIALELESFADQHRKKILFTEFGFESKDFCAAGHWEVSEETKKTNLLAQKNSYQAFFESYWNQDWVAGGFAWKWFYNHNKAGGTQNSKFTPQNKPAEKILKNKYLKL
jgi:hypothetical protein